MSWVGVITDAGLSALEEAVAGASTVDIDLVKTGSGTMSQASMHLATDLVSQVTTGTVDGIEQLDDGINVKMSVGPYDTSYTLKEVGMFATVGQSESVLIAYFNETSGGIVIPATSEFPDFVVSLYALLDIANSSSITATVDPDAYVSQSVYEEGIAGLAAAKLSISQGVANAGKFMVVNDSGNIVPVEIDEANGEEF